VTKRAAVRVAWTAAAMSLACVVTTATLDILNRRALHSIAEANPIELVVPIGFGLFGALVASRRRENPIGWLFLAIALIAGLPGVFHQYALRDLIDGPGSLWGSHVLGWVQDWLAVIIFPSGLLVFFFLLFPDGKLPSRRWRILAWLAIVDTAYGIAIGVLDPTPISIATGLPKIANPLGLKALGNVANGLVGIVYYLPALGLLIAAIVSVALRLRRSRAEDRQQLKALVYSAGVAVTWMAVLFVVAAFGAQLPDAFWAIPIAVGFGVMVPVACGIAILKHGLYEIDIVINKTVVYGMLAAFVTAVYAAIVIGVGAIVGSTRNAFLSIVATAVVAISFQPVRERARHLANRLVYGKRATPYEVLSDFAGRVAGAYSTDDVLPRMAQILAVGTGARMASVWLRVGSELRPEATWPSGDGAGSAVALAGNDLPPMDHTDTAVPVRHRGELLGALTVSMPPSEPLSSVHQKLVEDLASQAGLVLRNVRLIEELRASRERLVTAQDEARRRLERNIHDGAQQQLVALAIKTNLARQMVGRDEGKQLDLLDQLNAEAQDALETLRDLARGIYPPLLADQGLAAALEAQARKSPVEVNLDSNGIGRYPQNAEAAVYFCCLEALQNVAKYAEASGAAVTLREEDGALTFTVADDGRGFDPTAPRTGTGVQGMADRLEALGGSLAVQSAPGRGTVVAGRIPISG
jgi:signal transduction histidine kinase